MDFCPMEADERAVLLDQEESRRVEPWLAFAHLHVVERPYALVRMVGERAVVDLEPRLFVSTDDERAHVDTSRPIRRRHRREQRPPHPPRRPAAREAHRRREFACAGAFAVRPQPQPVTFAYLVDQRFDESLAI